jgi:hypothetical protein
MYWLVETEEQISYLINRGYKEAFIEVIPFNDNIHPALNDISLVYFKPSIERKGFMLCIDHSETLSIEKTRVNELLQGIDRLWVRDKKSTLFYFQIQSLLDVSLLIPPYIQNPTQAHTILYQKYPTKKDINKIVPIVKHYEMCEDIYENVKHGFDLPLTLHFEFYNKWATLAFFGIEKNGIKIDKDEFEKHFKRTPEEPFVFTSYNFKTLTTRPSNKFDGINYAALPKENGCRRSFIPRNDIFVEYDISAYHPTLSGQLIGFDFGDQDIHKSFASMYGVDYAKAKELTFKQLYGGVFKEYEHLEYFQQIKKYIDRLWENYTENGWIESPISGYQFREDKLENMNPQKLFNYVLQNLETATNVRILMELHKLLRGKNTKLVLYTYDSFLFDMDKSENLEQEIEKVFKKYEVNVKNSYGSTYDFTN